MRDALQLATVENELPYIEGRVGNMLNRLIGSFARFVKHTHEFILREELSDEASDLIEAFCVDIYENMALAYCEGPRDAWYLLNGDSADTIGKDKTRRFFETVLALLNGAVAYQQQSLQAIQTFRAIPVEPHCVLLLPETNLPALKELIAKVMENNSKMFYYNEETKTVHSLEDIPYVRGWRSELQRCVFAIDPTSLLNRAIRVNGD